MQAIPINNLCYGLYRTGLYNYLFIANTTPESTVNSTLLMVGEKIVPTPQRYWDGYYTGLFTQAEYDYLQEQYQRGVALDETVFAKLIEIQNEVTDRGRAVLYLLKVKGVTNEGNSNPM